MIFYKALADAQADAEAGFFRREKRVEKALQLLRGTTASGVGDNNFGKVLSFRRNRDRNFFLLAGHCRECVDAVAHQIQQNLLDLNAVSENKALLL